MSDDYQLVKLDGVRVERVLRVDSNEGWIELGYESNSLEFTILQVTLFGDYRFDAEKLNRIMQAVHNEL